MSIYKAKKIFTMYGKYSNIVTYEYHGKQYEVEYANDFSYCVTSPKYQHQIEQEKIDNAIDNPKSDYTGEPAEIGFNLFWDFVNGNGE